MATSLEELEKEVQIDHLLTNTFGADIAKISPVILR